MAVARLRRLVATLPSRQALIRRECLRLLALSAAAVGDCEAARRWLDKIATATQRRIAGGEEIERRCAFVEAFGDSGS